MHYGGGGDVVGLGACVGSPTVQEAGAVASRGEVHDWPTSATAPSQLIKSDSRILWIASLCSFRDMPRIRNFIWVRIGTVLRSEVSSLFGLKQCHSLVFVTSAILRVDNMPVNNTVPLSAMLYSGQLCVLRVTPLRSNLCWPKESYPCRKNEWSLHRSKGGCNFTSSHVMVRSLFSQHRPTETLLTI